MLLLMTENGQRCTQPSRGLFLPRGCGMDKKELSAVNTRRRLTLTAVKAAAVASLCAGVAATELEIQSHAGLTILGEISKVYSIEYVTDLADPAESDWRCLEFLQSGVDRSRPVSNRTDRPARNLGQWPGSAPRAPLTACSASAACPCRRGTPFCGSAGWWRWPRGHAD